MLSVKQIVTGAIKEAYLLKIVLFFHLCQIASLNTLIYLPIALPLFKVLKAL